MNNELKNNENEINSLLDNIKGLVINSRNRVDTTVNTEMLNLYWKINYGNTTMSLILNLDLQLSGL